MPLDPSCYAAYLSSLDTLSRQGQRVLAFCERTLPRDDFPPGYTFVSEPEPNFPADDLILVGLVALADPPRQSTAPSVRALREAGIAVVMVTGDAETTAEAVARQVRLKGEGAAAVIAYSDCGYLQWRPAKADSADYASLHYARAASTAGRHRHADRGAQARARSMDGHVPRETASSSKTCARASSVCQGCSERVAAAV